MKLTNLFVLSVLIFSFATTAVAHVVVRPDTVGIGAFQTFTVSTPSEKDEATVGIRLVLPEGLGSVTPTVKSGWNVKVVTDDSEEANPIEILWTGGKIPGHFRDDLTFSARVPAEPVTLLWKAYQTYSDGSVISWELGPDDPQPQKEEGGPDFSVFGPAAQTQIIDDLTEKGQGNTDTSLAFSIMALIIALASLVVSVRKKRG
jgi:uncharacterized protein YcnI